MLSLMRVMLALFKLSSSLLVELIWFDHILGLSHIQSVFELTPQTVQIDFGYYSFLAWVFQSCLYLVLSPYSLKRNLQFDLHKVFSEQLISLWFKCGTSQTSRIFYPFSITLLIFFLLEQTLFFLSAHLVHYPTRQCTTGQLSQNITFGYKLTTSVYLGFLPVTLCLLALVLPPKNSS